MSAAAEETDATAPVPAKQDPETLVLRARPRPAIRFRRGVIIGGTAIMSAGLIAVTWAALEPPAFRMAAESGQGEPRSLPTPDTLAKAPVSYGDVPRLGPPLPGDLGRPILEHQRSLEAAGEQAGSDPTVADAERARAAAEAERQSLAASEQAARASGVLVQLSGETRGENAPPSPPDAAPTRQELPAGEESRDRRAAFASSSPAEPSPDGLVEAASPWMLSAGTIISASLVTGLNSDLPGVVLAQVTEHVRDSATGRAILIPQGSRLIGRYDNVVAFGQQRALLVWQRIVLPDGSSVGLDNAPATDAAGYAGVADRVDFHTWRLLKGIALSTLLGIGTELSLGSEEGDLVRAVRESMQQSAARAGDQITKRNLEVQPTLTVRPGWPLRAIIHKDLILRPWRS